MKNRRATRADISAMISIQKKDGYTHQYYLTPERLSGLFDRGEKFFVVEKEGTAVGFGSVYCEIRAQVHFICVTKQFTGLGIGSGLMKACLVEAKKSGCMRACSFVEANSSKEPFLMRMGFTQVGFYKDRYGNGVDASIWEVVL